MLVARVMRLARTVKLIHRGVRLVPAPAEAAVVVPKGACKNYTLRQVHSVLQGAPLPATSESYMLSYLTLTLTLTSILCQTLN